MMHLSLLVMVTLGAQVSSEDTELEDLVITVGELVQMVNSEEITRKADNFRREEKQFSDKQTKVDFDSVVGEETLRSLHSYPIK